MELNGTRSNDRRHSQLSVELIGGLVYIAVANSIPQLILLVKEQLENSGIKDYKVPCES